MCSFSSVLGQTESFHCPQASVNCVICKTIQPNIKSMAAHYDSKHAKIKFAEVEALYVQNFADAKAGLPMKYY